MTTNVVGPPGAADGLAAAAHQRAVSTESIRSVVITYVDYRSSLPSRRISNDSRRPDGIAGEDEVDGRVSYVANELHVQLQLDRMTMTLPPGFERAVHVLCKEFEQRYEEAFREACGDIFITPDNAQTSFLTSVQSLFSDGVVNWGRVVALLAFSGSVAAQSVQKEMPFLVNQVIDWTSAYIRANLASWIYDNGGWEGLVKFYENGSSERRNGTSWPSFSTLCGCAFGAISVLTLGALLTQR